MQGRYWSGYNGCLGTHCDWTMGARHSSAKQFLAWKTADLEQIANKWFSYFEFLNAGTRPAQALTTPLTRMTGFGCFGFMCTKLRCKINIILIEGA